MNLKKMLIGLCLMTVFQLVNAQWNDQGTSTLSSREHKVLIGGTNTESSTIPLLIKTGTSNNITTIPSIRLHHVYQDDPGQPVQNFIWDIENNQGNLSFKYNQAFVFGMIKGSTYTSLNFNSELRLNSTNNVAITGNVALGTTSFPLNTKFVVQGNSVFNGNVAVNGGFNLSNNMKNSITSSTSNYTLEIKNTSQNNVLYLEGGRTCPDPRTCTYSDLVVCYNPIISDTVFRLDDRGDIFANRTIYYHGSAAPSTYIDGAGLFTCKAGSNRASIIISAVSGKIECEEIEVRLTEFPDYVFENNYKLMSLNELENYIKINKHLPDVPTASEVTENGANLGEMNKILLQKIEELTLYAIELQKQMDELKKQANN